MTISIILNIILVFSIFMLVEYIKDLKLEIEIQKSVIEVQTTIIEKCKKPKKEKKNVKRV